MAFVDLSLQGILKTQMNLHQAGQCALAHNVANADTPDFRPSDLKSMNTREPVRPRPIFRAQGTAESDSLRI